ncbi:MAG: hypothetical protein WKG07_08975 [Hymenobacter sp.]
MPQGAQYYYIPEIDGYYDLQAQQYIVLRNERWLPVAALSGYDPYQFHPVVLDYRGRQPWAYVRPTATGTARWCTARPAPGLPPDEAKKIYRQGYYDGRGLPPSQAKGLPRRLQRRPGPRQWPRPRTTTMATATAGTATNANPFA